MRIPNSVLGSWIWPVCLWCSPFGVFLPDATPVSLPAPSQDAHCVPSGPAGSQQFLLLITTGASPSLKNLLSRVSGASFKQQIWAKDEDTLPLGRCRCVCMLTGTFRRQFLHPKDNSVRFQRPQINGGGRMSRVVQRAWALKSGKANRGSEEPYSPPGCFGGSTVTPFVELTCHTLHVSLIFSASVSSCGRGRVMPPSWAGAHSFPIPVSVSSSHPPTPTPCQHLCSGPLPASDHLLPTPLSLPCPLPGLGAWSESPVQEKCSWKASCC